MLYCLCLYLLANMLSPNYFFYKKSNTATLNKYKSAFPPCHMGCTAMALSDIQPVQPAVFQSPQ